MTSIMRAVCVPSHRPVTWMHTFPHAIECEYVFTADENHWVNKSHGQYTLSVVQLFTSFAPCSAGFLPCPSPPDSPSTVQSLTFDFLAFAVLSSHSLVLPSNSHSPLKHLLYSTQSLHMFSSIQWVPQPIIVHPPRPELLPFALAKALNTRIRAFRQVPRNVIAAEAGLYFQLLRFATRW